MFENYEMAGVYIAIQAVLTLYAQGTVLYNKLNIIKENISEQNEVDIFFHLGSLLSKLFTIKESWVVHLPVQICGKDKHVNSSFQETSIPQRK